MTAAPVRFGFLSTARINDKALAGARESESVVVVAVGSRDATKAAAYARERGIERAHGSYEALIEDPDVEVVYISLPNQLHHEWTLRALAAGKHVLCEKPYSRRPHEVEQAFDAAERAGLLLSEAFMWRHNPQTRRLVELLPELGELELVRATFAFALADHANVRMRPELDGGALMDVGCYCVSGSRLIGGEPEHVYAEQTVGPTGVDVRLSGMLRWPSGLTAQISCSLGVSHESLEVIGTQGVLTAPDPWHCRRGLIVLNGEPVEVAPVSSYRLELENVASAVRGTGALLLGREDALGQARTIEALYRSAALGAPVVLGAGPAESGSAGGDQTHQ